MRYFLKIKYTSLVLLLLANTFLTLFAPVYGDASQSNKVIPKKTKSLSANTKLSHKRVQKVNDANKSTIVSPSKKTSILREYNPMMISQNSSSSGFIKPSKIKQSQAVNVSPSPTPVKTNANKQESILRKYNSNNLNPIVEKEKPEDLEITTLPASEEAQPSKEKSNFVKQKEMSVVPYFGEPGKEVKALPLGLPNPSPTPDDFLPKELPSQEGLIVPDVIVNDKKVIFRRTPVFNGTQWLFPLEEIASEVQDSVQVDLPQRTINVTRFRDRAMVSLDVSNGILTLNNNPFKTLQGFEEIILGTEVQLVPANAIALLHNLTLKIDEHGNYIFKSVITALAETQGTVQPQVRKGVRKISKDYLSANISVDGNPDTDLFVRRLEVNSGGHNDDGVVTSNFVVRGGTGGDVFLFDTGNLSYFKSESPYQLTLGDMTLATINSPFLSGVLLRGVSLQTPGGLKDSKVISGVGFLPSNQRLNGKFQTFMRFGRAIQISEWSSSPKGKYQFSVGEAVIKDTINNVFINAKQSGGIVTAKAVKTGMILEGESNLSIFSANDKRYEPIIPKKDETGTSSTDTKLKSKLVDERKTDVAGDLLLRYKPRKWFNLYGRTAYYGPDFYPLSGNLYYNDRNEFTSGANFAFKKINFGASHSFGKLNLDADKPSKYKVVNLFGTYRPAPKGPTITANYTKNLSQVNPDRSLFLFTNTQFINNPKAITIDDLLERRTTESFRLGLIQNWKKTNFSANFNNIKLNKESNITVPSLGGNFSDNFKSYDFSTYRTVSPRLALLNFSQFSSNFSQINWGFRAGPIRKFDIQAQLGFLKPKDKNTSPQYNINLRYTLNKKMSINFIYEKSDFFSRLFTLVRYNFVGDQESGTPSIQNISSFGKIKGRVYIKENIVSKQGADPSVLGKGLPNVRIYFAGQEYKTDKNGYYEIPKVSKGTHNVKVDFSDIPAYLASLSNENIDVQVEPGKDTVYDFVLTYYGSVKGKVILVGDNPTPGEENIKDIPGIRVYLEGTDFEALTDNDGSYEVTDITPGKYKVLVDPDFLIEGLESVKEDIFIDIKPKQKVENIILKIKYVNRLQQEKEF